MRQSGIVGVNPSHPDFIALLAQGVSDDELSFASHEAAAKGKPFAYAVAMMLGRRKDAAARAANGAGAPSPQQARWDAYDEALRGWAGASARKLP